jgi:HK97 family phage prohead protease
MKVFKKVFTSELKSIDEKEMTLTAYVSTGARDRMNESLDPAGVDLTNYRKNPVVLWAHDYSLPPIGKAEWVKRDKSGVLSKVKFASTAFAQEIFQLYKEGFLKAFSVGFVPTKTEDGDGQKEPRRTYRKWEMLEFSAVPVPANPEALSLAMQKGILKSDSLKSLMQESLQKDGEEEGEEEAPAEEEISTEEEEKPKEEEKPAEEIPDEKGLEDLMAENDLLREVVDSLNEEIVELRYKLYLKSTKKDEKKEVALSGITVDTLANKVAEVVNGVIRKHQGKID